MKHAATAIESQPMGLPGRRTATTKPTTANGMTMSVWPPLVSGLCPARIDRGIRAAASTRTSIPSTAAVIGEARRTGDRPARHLVDVGVEEPVGVEFSYEPLFLREKGREGKGVGRARGGKAADVEDATAEQRASDLPRPVRRPVVEDEDLHPFGGQLLKSRCDEIRLVVDADERDDAKLRRRRIAGSSR